MRCCGAGRPALHIEFGADIALLAALALLNEAYAIFASLPSLLPIAVREIGLGGMIGGQAADLCGSQEPSRIRKRRLRRGLPWPPAPRPRAPMRRAPKH